MSSAIGKQLNLLDYALSSLVRRWSKNVAIVGVFATVIFLLASFHLLTNALTRFARELLVTAPEITVQRLVAGRQESMPLAYQERLRGIFGIRRVTPRVWGYYFDERNGANYTVVGMDAKSPLAGRLASVLAEGRFPDRPGEAVLGGTLYRSLDLAGRRVFSLARPDLSRQAFTVCGVFDDSAEVLTADMLFTDLESARRLFGISPDQVTDLLVTVANPAEVQTIAAKIAELLPDTRVVTRRQIQKTYEVVFGWRSGFASVCLLAAMTAFVIFAWDRASGLSPEERREIAILKILGWETSDILIVRFWEGLLVAGIAFLLGLLAAYAHVLYFDAGLFRPLMLGWSVLRPTIRLLPSVHLADLLLLASFSVLPYLAATVVPAWRCVAVPPDAVIR